jgi:glutathione S-transferase
MTEPNLTLYASIASRSFTARWMLEELGLPYRVHPVDIR